MVVSLLQIYNFTQQFQTRAKRSAQVLTNKKQLLPSVIQIYKFTATPTFYSTKQPHLLQIKVAFTYKNLPVGTVELTTQTCYSNKSGAAESSRCVLQSLLLPCRMPTPHPAA
jgi:phage gpG-like protein